MQLPKLVSSWKPIWSSDSWGHRSDLNKKYIILFNAHVVLFKPLTDFTESQSCARHSWSGAGTKIWLGSHLIKKNKMKKIYAICGTRSGISLAKTPTDCSCDSKGKRQRLSFHVGRLSVTAVQRDTTGCAQVLCWIAQIWMMCRRNITQNTCVSMTVHTEIWPTRWL